MLGILELILIFRATPTFSALSLWLFYFPGLGVLLLHSS